MKYNEGAQDANVKVEVMEKDDGMLEQGQGEKNLKSEDCISSTAAAAGLGERHDLVTAILDNGHEGSHGGAKHDLDGKPEKQKTVMLSPAASSSPPKELLSSPQILKEGEKSNYSLPSPPPVGLSRHSNNESHASSLLMGANAMYRQPGAQAIPGTGTSASPQNEIESNGSDQGITSQLTNFGDHDVPVEATVVPEQEEQDLEAQKLSMELEIRERIMQEAVQASSVLAVPGDATTEEYTSNNNGNNAEGGTDTKLKTKIPNEKGFCQRKLLWLFLFLFLTVLAVGLGVGLTRETSEAEADVEAEISNTDNLSTLELVKRRGYVRCGVSEFDFVKAVTPENQEEHKDSKPFRGPHLVGFNVEQCRAMALLALGDPNKYELVQFDVYYRFHDLKEGRIDVMPDGSTHTMERDLWIRDVQAAFAFTVPYFYSGLTLAGKPSFVDCVDASDTFHGLCRELRICVSAGSTHVGVLEEIVQGSVLVPSNSTEILIQQYRQEQCNVIAGENLFLGKMPDDVTTGAQWKYSRQVVSKEPLAIVTRNNDREWSDLANLVTNTFIIAEANNITQETAHLMAGLFQGEGEDILDAIDSDESGAAVNKSLATQMVSLIAQFGNHGELYEKHIQSQIPRDSGLNQPYTMTQTNGLLYSIPFGNLNDHGPVPVPGGVLERIIQRGHLLCGVQSFRGTGFASFRPSNSSNSTEGEWSGFDVEFCKGLSASIFAGNKDKVVFLDLLDPLEAFSTLSADSVDVVAGARISLQADQYEATTQQGYSFSSPYYYDNGTRESYAFMTRDKDIQWTDFVYWIVMAIIYAEEQGITSKTSVEMPVVTLFGENLKQCFRDCISAVGSYDELYNSSLQEFTPRAGANRLNSGMPEAQMFPLSPN